MSPARVEAIKNLKNAAGNEVFCRVMRMLPAGYRAEIVDSETDY